MANTKEVKIDDRYLVQVPNDLESIVKLPLADRIVKIKLGSCGKAPEGNIIEETKLIGAYGIKTKKLSIPQSEYFVVSAKTIDDPDITLLSNTYSEMGLNPKIGDMQIRDGVDDRIVWKSGSGRLTAIARNGDYLTEEDALSLAKEVGGHVCLAEVIERTLNFQMIKCLKA